MEKYNDLGDELLLKRLLKMNGEIILSGGFKGNQLNEYREITSEVLRRMGNKS